MKCRSLGPCSPLAGQLRGLQSNWLPLGKLLCVQWSNEKEAHLPFFFLVVVAVFFYRPSLLCIYCGRENRQPPPPLCVPLNHPLPTSVAASCLPLSYYCFWKQQGAPSSLFLHFLTQPFFSHFCHVFADKTQPPVYISCSFHYTLSAHLLATIHSSQPMLHEPVVSNIHAVISSVLVVHNSIILSIITLVNSAFVCSKKPLS